MAKSFDTPNFVLTAGEYIQDIRDRDIKLGISALAGFLEDLAKPDSAAFERARWSAITDVVPMGDNTWQTTQPDVEAGVNRKNKEIAVIVGVSELALEECRENLGSIRTWPSAAYSYRGVDRIGLLPNGFGQIDDYAAVGMMKGRKEFKTALGLTWIQGDGFLRAMVGKVRRSDLKGASLFIPDGLRVLDEVPAEDMPPNVPLV